MRGDRINMEALQLVSWQHEAELREAPEPEPGPGEVLVRIGAAGACHSDLHLMSDFAPGLLAFDLPFTLGHENAGWVQALGAGVTGFEIGQPVAVYGPWGCGRCPRCLAGLENYCDKQAQIGAMGGGLGRDGGMAELMVVPNPRHLVPLRDLDPVHAAPLTDAGLTPYHAVKRSLHILTPGSTAVVIGVGGLGHMAVQLLDALSPATIIAVDQRDEPLELASRVGATHTLKSGAETAAVIRDLTDGLGADLILDFVGADGTMALGAAVARPMGHLTIVGIAGGVLPVSFFGIGYEVSVATTYWGSLPELVEVLELAEAGRIHAEVTEVSLAEAPKAYEMLRQGEVAGRMVVVP